MVNEKLINDASVSLVWRNSTAFISGSNKEGWSVSFLNAQEDKCVKPLSSKRAAIQYARYQLAQKEWRSADGLRPPTIIRNRWDRCDFSLWAAWQLGQSLLKADGFSDEQSMLVLSQIQQSVRDSLMLT